MTEQRTTTSGPTEPRRVAVLTHTGRDAAIAAARDLARDLAEAGIEPIVPAADLTEMAGQFGDIEVHALPADATSLAGCELAVVLGGDGTILRAAELALASHTPLLGVNLGHVGFLAEAESSEIHTIARRVIDRDWTVEERFVIEVLVEDAEDRTVWSSFAINEVSIEKDARERMLEVMVDVDGRPLSRWSCDGILLATPTGSTAYAFSAGGPVVWPEVDALLLVPLSAHALFARPLVLGPSSDVRIDLLDTPPARRGVVWCDGRRSVTLLPGMSVRAHKSGQRLRLARLSSAPFTDRLVNKFGLQVEGWRGSRES
ncbi:NAD kinase [Naumannella cuiyingiana]|uniref:NAD kinase n=1 Tax=Naumannella cuiyingiana TaxID=1347891 RepID=A0A7Z0DB87_9ACTN|nr:NAD kinase [Naumannella cuiyingiana]NYI72415.1 NAD+ kinase [Naumannella cuiyingiana]